MKKLRDKDFFISFIKKRHLRKLHSCTATYLLWASACQAIGNPMCEHDNPDFHFSTVLKELGKENIGYCNPSLMRRLAVLRDDIWLRGWPVGVTLTRYDDREKHLTLQDNDQLWIHTDQLIDDLTEFVDGRLGELL